MPETAIGGEGRTVRCAKCKHSWFQEPKPLDLTEPVATAPRQPTAPTQEKPQTKSVPDLAPAGPDKPASENLAESENPAASPKEPAARSAPLAGTQANASAQQGTSEPAPGPSVNHWKTSDRPHTAKTESSGEDGVAARALRQGMGDRATGKAATDTPPPETAFDPDADPLARYSEDPESQDADYDFDDYDDASGSQFDYSPPFSRRRNPLKMWTIAAGVFALLASGTVVAVNYYGLPDWFPISQPTFALGKEGLELDFPASEQRKATLESGEEIFEVRGKINNISAESLSVPNLLIVFRDERNKNVYSWVVVPAKGELAPGESLNVTEAVTDIPVSAKAAEIGWSPN